MVWLNTCMMRKEEIITYKSASAYYQVEEQDAHTTIATLEKYTGHHQNRPPQKVVYLKNKASFPATNSLLDDIAITLKKQL